MRVVLCVFVVVATAHPLRLRKSKETGMMNSASHSKFLPPQGEENQFSTDISGRHLKNPAAERGISDDYS